MILFIVSLVFIIFLCGLTCIRPRNYPPGPKFYPIIGNFLQYKKKYSKCHYHHLVWLDLAKEYGTVVGTKMGRNYVVTVSGWRAIKEVLTREEFQGRPDSFLFRIRTLGKRLGIVFSDGLFWKKQRRFSHEHLKKFGFGRNEIEENIQMECQAFIDFLKNKCDEGPIIINDIFDISVMNVLWLIVAGKRFDLYNETLSKILGLIRDCFRSVDGLGGIINQLPFIRHIAPDASGYTMIVNAMAKTYNFLEKTVEEHKMTRIEKPRDFIDSFLQSMDVNLDETFSKDQLLAVCLDLFMAGFETTSSSLSFAVMYMILYPEIQEKVHKEIDEVLPNINQWPSSDHKSQLKYTQAVLLETQRITHVAPMGIPRRVTETTDLLGYKIPNGTIVLTNFYTVHMDEMFWHEPHKFKPERFFDENGDVFIDKDHYIPFGLGKRRCLGEVIGKTNVFLFFTFLLQNFTLEACEDSPPSLQPCDGFSLAPKPFKCKINRRKNIHQ